MPEHPTDAHFSFTFVFKQALILLLKALLQIVTKKSDKFIINQIMLVHETV